MELSATREGIGDISSSVRAGAARETPKGANKRDLTSLVTPIVRNNDLSSVAEHGDNGITKVQKRKEKEIKNMSSLGAMMHRMKEGLPPDEASEESTDEEELEAYLSQWHDEDGDHDSGTGWTDDEYNGSGNTVNNGFDGNGMDIEGDYGRGNDFVKSSSLRRFTDSAKKDITENGTRRANRTNQKNTGNTDTINKAIRFMDDVGNDRTNEVRNNARNLGVSSGRAAREIRMETEALKVGPGLNVTPEQTAPSQKMYTYNMQISFIHPLGEEGKILKKGNYHVPTCFKQVIRQFNILSPAITLVPYNTHGVPITDADQLPDNEIEDYITYFHNHHVTAGGQLTGMCCIEAPLTWYQLKDEKKTLFKWLKDKGVFMKYVSFKANQVSAAGWFYSMHPDVIKKDEAATEIRKRLGENLPDDLSIQMVPRMLSITDKVTRNRFSFKGVAIECERSRVRELQEALYKMDSPEKAKYSYGITGGTLFVPFVENDVWTNGKILGMAKAHVQEMNKLGQIFLQNVQDIDKLLQWTDGDEESLRTMLTNCSTSDGHKMIHSVHKANREGTVTILYYKEYTTEVNNTFPDIQEILQRQLTEESKGLLATEGKRITMTGRQNHVEGSVAAKEYASYADIILEGMNPQGGEDEEEEYIIQSPPRKKAANRRTPPRLTYSQAATASKSRDVPKKRKADKRNTEKGIASTTADSDSTSENTDNENDLTSTMQERFAKMEAQFEARFGKVVGIDIDTAKHLIEENNKEIKKSSEEFFEKKFEELSINLTKEIQRSNDLIFEKFATLHEQQNTVVYTLQEMVKNEFLKIYANLSRMQAGQPIEQTNFTVAGPGTSTTQASDGRQ